MWQLHNLIKDSLPDKEEEYLIHETIKIMERITPSDFKDSLRIMYGDDFHVNKNPAEFAVLFVKGIKNNNLFSFVSFIKSVNR